MLPDYPEIKDKLYRRLKERITSTRDQTLGFFATIPRHRLFEGHKTLLVNADGSQHEQELREIAERQTFAVQELESLTQEEIAERFDVTAANLARQIGNSMIDHIQTALGGAAQVRDARGEPVTPKSLLEMLEAIQMDFADDGRPLWPSIVAGPQAEESIRRAIEEFESSPDWKEQRERLIRRKREEWCARESARKLVG